MEIFDPLCLCSNPSCKEVFSFGSQFICEGFINNGVMRKRCPRCNSYGFVPTGDFKRNSDMLLALTRELSRQNVESLELEIRRYLSINKKPNAIKKDLKKKFPQHRKLWNSLPENTQDMILLLGWLIGVLGALSGIASFVASEMSDVDIKLNIINPSINFYFDKNESHNESLNKMLPPPPKQYEI